MNRAPNKMPDGSRAFKREAIIRTRRGPDLIEWLGIAGVFLTVVLIVLFIYQALR
jgi:hypothetical protein